MTKIYAKGMGTFSTNPAIFAVWYDTKTVKQIQLSKSDCNNSSQNA